MEELHQRLRVDGDVNPSGFGFVRRCHGGYCPNRVLKAVWPVAAAGAADDMKVDPVDGRKDKGEPIGD